MQKEEATQHALGYAAGREDASGIRTAQTGERSGFVEFADAFATAWDDYNNERRCYMTNARDAYDTWQETRGATIFKDEASKQPSLEDRARAIGAQHGTNAAGWVFDGNTTRETYERVLRGIEDIDPLVMDAYREPSLSGEFADDYSIGDLQSDLGIEIDWTRNDTQDAVELLDECAIAYNDAASSAFWTEVERIARYQLEETGE